MFKKIQHKLLFYFLLLSIGPLSLAMYWVYTKSVEKFEQRTYDQLKTVRETKKKEIESYFNLIRQQAIYFGGGTLILNAFKDFNAAFAGLKSLPLPTDYTEQLKAYYQNQFYANLRLIQPDTFSLDKLYPKDKRSVLLQTQYLISNKTAFQSNAYNAVHEKYHNAFSTFTKLNGFYDIFLIEDETGYVIYSVTKEIDFATSLLSDAHADSNLGRLFRKVRYSGLKYNATMIDFEPYLPSYLAPAAFIAAPIYDGQRKVGTLVFQIPNTRINDITTSNKEWKEEGLGATGESYIIGSDCKMRTDSRFIIESPDAFLEQTKHAAIDPKERELIKFYKTTILFLTVCNESVTHALAQQSGTFPMTDYRGIDVLSSHTALNIPDVNWVFLAEIDKDEALMPIRMFGKNFALLVIGVAALVIFVSWLVAITLSRPIRKLARATQELGDGNLHVQVPVTSQNELGMLERSFNKTVEALHLQHTHLLEKQEEITLQAEQLSLVNKELVAKNEELDYQKGEILQKKSIVEQQKEEITAQAENLMQLNQEIVEINSNLEAIVKDRTERLEEQNHVLADYAFTNAHKLRGPLTRIMGLINIIQSAETLEEKLEYIRLLSEAGNQLDEAVHTIQKLIAENENHHPQHPA